MPPNGNDALRPIERWVLMACGPMNVVGAICFVPPFPDARVALGLPEPHPFYLWLLSVWVLAFGVAYFHQGWSGRANRAVLALGVVGKASFGGLLIGDGVSGELPPFAVAGGLPDFGLAVLFAWYLWRTH
jgi:hypothetical protein